MKPRICCLLLLAGLTALADESRSEWSEPEDGLRARIVLSIGQELKAWIELSAQPGRSVTLPDISHHRVLCLAMVTLEVEDALGNPVHLTGPQTKLDRIDVSWARLEGDRLLALPAQVFPVLEYGTGLKDENLKAKQAELTDLSGSYRMRASFESGPKVSYFGMLDAPYPAEGWVGRVQTPWIPFDVKGGDSKFVPWGEARGGLVARLQVIDGAVQFTVRNHRLMKSIALGEPSIRVWARREGAEPVSYEWKLGEGPLELDPCEELSRTERTEVLLPGLEAGQYRVHAAFALSDGKELLSNAVAVEVRRPR